MSIITGLSCFISRSAANRYYERQGETAEDVNDKLNEGVISIGKPSKLPKDSVFRWDEDGRGQLHEMEPLTVTLSQREAQIAYHVLHWRPELENLSPPVSNEEFDALNEKLSRFQ